MKSLFDYGNNINIKFNSSSEFTEFIEGRFRLFDNEISKMFENQDYLIPNLITVLYTEPLKTDLGSPVNYGFDSLMLPIEFKTKFKGFLEAINKLLPTFSEELLDDIERNY